MKKQEATVSEKRTKDLKSEPQPSTSRTPAPTQEASSSSSSTTPSASSSGGPIDFGDASQYVEVSPIGTGKYSILEKDKLTFKPHRNRGLVIPTL